MLHSLDLSHMEIIVSELRSTLQKGFERHILGYTIYIILQSINGSTMTTTVKKTTALSVSCVHDVWTVINDELLGVVAREKSEIQQHQQRLITKFKEIRAKKGLECAELLGSYIDVAGLNLIVNHLRRLVSITIHFSTKETQTILDMVRRLSSGLIRNSYITLEDLMVTCYALLVISDPPAPSTDEEGIITTMYFHRIQPEEQVKIDAKASGHSTWLLIEFGLCIIYGLLKKDLFRPIDPHKMGLLDPFVEMSVTCLASTRDEIVIGSLKLMGQLIQYPLPSLADVMVSLYEALFKLIRKAPSMTCSIAQHSIKLMTIVLRDFKGLEVPEKPIKTLVSLIIPELLVGGRGDSESTTTTVPTSSFFSFLKAIIGRRMIVSELFDAMERVAALMVQSQLDRVREHARQVFFQFLMEFPIGKRRLDDYIVFLVKNLSYEYEAGRLSVLEVMSSILYRFPERIVVQYAMELFLPLVLRLTNDDVSICREAATKCLETLLKRLPNEMMSHFMNLAQHWLNGGSNSSNDTTHEKPALKMASLYVLPILLSAMKDKKDTADLSSLYATFSIQIGHHMFLLEKQKKSLYHEKMLALGLKALILLLDAKMSHQDISTMIGSRLSSYLLSEDHHIRNVSSQLILKLLQSSVDTNKTDASSLQWMVSLERPLMLAESICQCIQQDDGADEASVLILVKSLVLIGTLFYTRSSLFVTYKEEDNKSRHYQVNDEDDLNQDEEDDDAVKMVRQRYMHLTYLFRYITKAVKREIVSQTTSMHLNAFRWFAAMTSIITPKDLEAYVFYMTWILYRVLEHNNSGNHSFSSKL
jgi:U3 small nucleolar RNA-associated protein 20